MVGQGNNQGLVQDVVAIHAVTQAPYYGIMFIEKMLCSSAFHAGIESILKKHWLRRRQIFISHRSICDA
jgi:hypothetical protein